MTRRPLAERESEIVALLRERGNVRKRDIEEALGWSRPTASNILGTLVNQGVIVHTDPNPRSPQQGYRLVNAAEGPASSSPVAKSSPASDLPPLERVRAKIGRMPDAEVAALAGVSVDEVKVFRREHGISPFLRPPPSSASAPAAVPRPDRLPPLRLTNAPAAPVVVRRHTDGDGPPSETVTRPPAPAPAPVSAASVAPVSPLAAYQDRLGKVADHVIADETGLSRSQVGDYRRKLGIAAYDGFRYVSRGPAKAPVEQEAHPGRSAIETHRDLLGTASDAEIAAVIGVSRSAVTNYRIRHGIAPFLARSPSDAAAVAAPADAASPSAAEAAASPRVSARGSKLDAHRDIVGVLSDSEVAARTGMSPEGVRMFRKRHGIPARGAGASRGVADTETPVRTEPPPETEAGPATVTPPPVPTPAASPVVSPPLAAEPPTRPEVVAEPAPAHWTTSSASASSHAFVVTAACGEATQRFVSVGVDVTEALANAVAALRARPGGPWRVKMIREFAEALIAPGISPKAPARTSTALADADRSEPPSARVDALPTSPAVAPPPARTDADGRRVYTGADLRAYRTAHGLSQKELGARLGAGNQSMISVAETALHKPLRPVLQEALATALAEDDR